MSLLVVGSMAYDDIETPRAQVQDALGGSATFFFDRGELFLACQSRGGGR